MTACLLISAAAMAILVSLSLLADRRFSDVAQLPMQFGLDGKPTWIARRAAALSLTPSVAAAILLLLAATRAGSVRGGLVVTVIVAATFLAAHMFHLWLIHRWTRQ